MQQLLHMFVGRGVLLGCADERHKATSNMAADQDYDSAAALRMWFSMCSSNLVDACCTGSASVTKQWLLLTSRAVQPPWPKLGVMGCAASPARVIAPSEYPFPNPGHLHSQNAPFQQA